MLLQIMNSIYLQAERNEIFCEATCVGISQYQWDRLMKNHTRANKKLVTKAALKAGIIDEQQAKMEIKKPYFNPYNHFKTKTHLIYVHSGIEHFIRVN